jgi:hypothetical protein
MMGDLENTLGEIGAKQWVRNQFVAKLKAFSESGNKDVDKFIAEFNAEIFVNFKKLASAEINDVITRAAQLMEVK